MEELIKLVSSKVKIPEDQAKKAVETVLGFLKDKLPAPIAAQIEGVVSGKSGEKPGADLMGGLNSLLGGKK